MFDNMATTDTMAQHRAKCMQSAVSGAMGWIHVSDDEICCNWCMPVALHVLKQAIVLFGLLLSDLGLGYCKSDPR